MSARSFRVSSFQIRKASIRTQVSFVDKGNSVKGGFRQRYVQDIYDVLQEIPGDFVLLAFVVAVALLFNASFEAVAFGLGVSSGFVTLGMCAACSIPLKFNLLFHTPYLVAGISLLVLYQQRESTNQEKTSRFVDFVDSDADLFGNYLWHSVILISSMCVSIFLFEVFLFAYRGRLTASGILGISFFVTISCFLVGMGVLLFQWHILFDPSLTPTQELFFVGIGYPLFGASVGRVLFSDMISFMDGIFVCEKVDSGWSTAEALHVRIFWITANRIIVGFTGFLAIFHVESNVAFGLSLVLSNLIEIGFSYGWFLLTSRGIPNLRNKYVAHTTRASKVAPLDQVDQEKQEEESENRGGEEAMKNEDEQRQLALGALQDSTRKFTFKQAVALWVSNFGDKETVTARFALNRCYEERVERASLLCAVAVLLVCGSTATNTVPLVFRGLGAYAIEILLVDPTKSICQRVLLGSRPLRRQQSLHEYYSFVSMIVVSLALFFFARYFCVEFGRPIDF